LVGLPERAGAAERGADRGQQRRERFGLVVGGGEHADGRVLGAEQVSGVWMLVRVQSVAGADHSSLARSAPACDAVAWP
jgi:hypothetical protein